MQILSSSMLPVIALVAAVSLPAATPLSPEEQVSAARAEIELRRAQVELNATVEKYRQDIQDAKEKLRATAQKYLSVVQTLQEEHDAKGCDLDTNQEWVNCEPPKPTSATKD